MEIVKKLISVKCGFWVFTAFALLACAATIVKDPELVQKQLVGFNVAVQSANYEEALEMLVAEERNQIMNANGEVKEKYSQGMKRLNISALKSKNLYLVGGKIKGMLNVLEEANRANIISEEQRTLGISISSSIKEVSSSNRYISSSSSMRISSAIDTTAIDGFEAPDTNEQTPSEVLTDEFSTPEVEEVKEPEPPVEEFETPSANVLDEEMPVESSAIAVPTDEFSVPSQETLAPDEPAVDTESKMSKEIPVDEFSTPQEEPIVETPEISEEELTGFE